MGRPLHVYRLGRVEYADGLELQRQFAEARAAGGPDTLLLLEHPPVLTLGRAGKRENITASGAQLARVGAEIFETNRGGDVTYHGPGQLVGYPLLELPPDRQDVRRFVRDVEEVTVRTVAEYGLHAAGMPKWPGVWLGSEAAGDARKICAIGVHLSRWRTSHGFALNVNTDLSHFGLIVPCGIREAGVTSLERELGHPLPVPEVEAHLVRHFAEVFGFTPAWQVPVLRTVSVVVTRGEGVARQVLLLRRREERGGFWQCVTGKVDPGESPRAAARRELQEETGASLEVSPLEYVHAFALGQGPLPRVCEEAAFAARWAGGEPVLDPAEHDAARWLGPDEAAALLPFAGLRRALSLALSGR
ncbi:MAG: lipoyl(octanoyl) transferase LipB [Deltaproteobacteria bacterium]|nr:lipoyl(octanoyl) transferase LipB [Deltaproteobacteria bacterium]